MPNAGETLNPAVQETLGTPHQRRPVTRPQRPRVEWRTVNVNPSYIHIVIPKVFHRDIHRVIHCALLRSPPAPAKVTTVRALFHVKHYGAALLVVLAVLT